MPQAELDGATRVYGDLAVVGEESQRPPAKPRRAPGIIAATSLLLLAGSIYWNIRQEERHIDQMAMQAVRRFQAFHDTNGKWPIGEVSFDVPKEVELLMFCKAQKASFMTFSTDPESIRTTMTYSGALGSSRAVQVKSSRDMFLPFRNALKKSQVSLPIRK